MNSINARSVLFIHFVARYLALLTIFLYWNIYFVNILELKLLYSHRIYCVYWKIQNNVTLLSNSDIDIFFFHFIGYKKYLISTLNLFWHFWHIRYFLTHTLESVMKRRNKVRSVCSCITELILLVKVYKSDEFQTFMMSTSFIRRTKY